jgi:hypothetical protein
MADKKFYLGAFEQNTNKYTLPFFATKDKEYKCVDCAKKVILRKGNIRAHHFAHFAESNCSYYDHPNESQIHKDAKLLLQKLLQEKKRICFTWECSKCSNFYAFQDVPTIHYKEGDEVILEHHDKENKWIVDVAIVNKNDVRYIFEIKNTHKTVTLRPEPWFEIDAYSFIKKINDITEDAKKDNQLDFMKDPYFSIDIPCIRTDLKRMCYGSFCYKEKWVCRIPGFDEKNKQNNNCILCNKEDYDPSSDGCTGKFQNGSIRVCVECLWQDIFEKKLRSLFLNEIVRKKEIAWSKDGSINIVASDKEKLTEKEREILKNITPLSMKYGDENMWIQILACSYCKRIKYNPFYYERKYYSICKLCFNNEASQNIILDKIQKNEIKKESKCLIQDDD